MQDSHSSSPPRRPPQGPTKSSGPEQPLLAGRSKAAIQQAGIRAESTARLRKQKKALVQLAKARFSRSAKLEATFRRITEVAAHCLDLDRAGLWLLSADREKLCCRQLYDATQKTPEALPELKAQRYASYLKSLQKHRTLAAEKIRKNSRFWELSHGAEEQAAVKSSIDAAIKLNGKVVGMICLEAFQKRKWTADEEHFAGSLADIAALALKDAELRNAEILRKALAELGKKLNACTTSQMAVRRIGETAQKLWGWDAIFLNLYDHVAERLIPVLNIDTVNGRKVSVPSLPRPALEDLEPVMEHKKLLLNGPLPANIRLRRFGDVGRPSRSRMFITIRRHGRPLAVLSIQSYSPNAYDQAALNGLEALGEYCTGAIARLQAEALRRESEERFRGLGEATTEGIVVHNATRIFEVNPKMTRMFGYTSEELKQKKLPTLLAHPSLNGNSFGKKGHHSTQEAIGIRQNGKTFPIELVTRPCRFLGKPAQVTVIRDISDRKRVEQQLRNHSRQILEAQENERFRVSRDLHDSVNQVLTAARLNLETLTRSLPSPERNTRTYVAKTQALLAKAMEEIRLISWNLRPNELDDAGLPLAIRTLCSDCEERTGITIRCDFPDHPARLSPETAVALFRIVQEALNNACRHSAASRIEMTIRYNREVLTLDIVDDGIGFHPHEVSIGDRTKGGLGLTNMRERALSVKGAFYLRSSPGKGTAIRLTLPVAKVQVKRIPVEKTAP